MKIILFENFLSPTLDVTDGYGMGTGWVRDGYTHSVLDGYAMVLEWVRNLSPMGCSIGSDGSWHMVRDGVRNGYLICRACLQYGYSMVFPDCSSRPYNFV